MSQRLLAIALFTSSLLVLTEAGTRADPAPSAGNRHEQEAKAALKGCPAAGTTFPREPVRFNMEKTSIVRIELSQLPETRLIGVLDNREGGKQIPLVWDPLESPRLGYNVTVGPGWWSLSFRSDPLYRTAESTSAKADIRRVSLSYRAVSEHPPLRPEYARCVDQQKRLQADNLDTIPAIGPDCVKPADNKGPFFGYPYCLPDNLIQAPRIGSPNESSVSADELGNDEKFIQLAYIRMQPFNLFDIDQADGDGSPSKWQNRKQDIIVQVFRRELQGGDAADVERLLREISNMKKKRREIEEKIFSIEKAGRALDDSDTASLKALNNDAKAQDEAIGKLQGQLDHLQKKTLDTVSAAIARMDVSESRAISGRSLTDPVPQAIADLFSLLAEIAFDRAKAKSFSLISERATKLVCTDLTGTLLHSQLGKLIAKENARRQEHNKKKPNEALAMLPSASFFLWWIRNEDRPLLPQTCETVRSLRIQELATSGKSIYESLIKDISAFPVSLLDSLPAHLFDEISKKLDLAKKDLDNLSLELSSNPDSSEAETVRSIREYIDKIKRRMESLILRKEVRKDSDRDLYAALNIAILARRLSYKLSTLPKYKELSSHWQKEGYIKLLEDVEKYGRGTLAAMYVVRPLTQALASAVRRYASGGGGFDERDVQLLLVSFAKEFARQTDGLLPLALPSASVCPVRFGLAVVAECHRRGGCDAAAISQYLQEPNRLLRDEVCNSVDPKSWSGIAQFISRALEVVRASKTTAPEVQLRNVVELLFDATELVLAKQQDAVFPFDRDSWVALRSVSVGAIEHDPQKLLVGFARLVSVGLAQPQLSGKSPEFGKALQKFSALAGAVASYTQSYPAGGEPLDEKQAKAQREARKRAIESMMDLTTNRTARGGDFIVSMGIHPGFSLVGGQLGPGTTGQSNLFYTQLTLPTGIALQWLAPHPCKALGWHLQFSILDLAQFVSFDGNTNLSMNNLRWADFVMAGVQGGVLVGSSPNAQFFIGADLRYAPTLSYQPGLAADASPAAVAEQDQRRGVFRVGFTVGYYVPFFDFN